MKIPSKLKKKDKAIVLSPSGCVEDNFIQGAVTVLKSWDLDVHISRFASGKHGRYAGTLDQRLSDLQEAMDDKATKLVFCSRGGYGIIQLLDKLNFEGIRKNPKWIVGFSDITALHLALMQEGIVSLHGPMARHLTEYPYNAATSLLRKALFEKELSYNLYSLPFNRHGEVKGTIFGGNLAILTSLIGTPLMKLPKNPILFIEDVAEAPYKIDRMMWQLKLSGVLKNLSGLIVGQFSDYKEDPSMGFTVSESIWDMVKEYKYPVVFDFPVGHIEDNYSILNGSKVNLVVKNENVNLKFEK